MIQNLFSDFDLTGLIKGTAKRFLYSNYVPLFWSKTLNWGDALNPYLVQLISGKKARFETAKHTYKYQVIGSILQQADKNTIVWGSGFISTDAIFTDNPKQILAVRGHLTAQRLSNLGVRPPNIFGDPALLISKYYTPTTSFKYKIGIIPHYCDIHHPWLNSFDSNGDIIIINILQSIESFIDMVASCEFILSSSLHGLICADAYGIPRLHIVLGDDLIGGEFKFLDYHSVMDGNYQAITINSDTIKPNILTDYCRIHRYNGNIDLFLQSCPFFSRK